MAGRQAAMAAREVIELPAQMMMVVVAVVEEVAEKMFPPAFGRIGQRIVVRCLHPPCKSGARRGRQTERGQAAASSESCKAPWERASSIKQ